MLETTVKRDRPVVALDRIFSGAFWLAARFQTAVIPSSQGSTCSVARPKERRSVIFDASSDGSDETEANQFERVALVTSRGSPDIIPVTQSGRRRVMPFLIESKTGTEKWFISVLWSVNGIHSLLDVPKGTMYNTEFFADVIMPGLIKNIKSKSNSRRKMLVG
jgi:hypothetical protein